jgi:hypothetical protein
MQAGNSTRPILGSFVTTFGLWRFDIVLCCDPSRSTGCRNPGGRAGISAWRRPKSRPDGGRYESSSVSWPR